MNSGFSSCEIKEMEKNEKEEENQKIEYIFARFEFYYISEYNVWKSFYENNNQQLMTRIMMMSLVKT